VGASNHRTSARAAGLRGFARIRRAARTVDPPSSLLTTWRPGSIRVAIAASLSLGVVATLLALGLDADQPSARPAIASSAGRVVADAVERTVPEDPTGLGEPVGEVAQSTIQADAPSVRSEVPPVDLATPVAVAMASPSDGPVEARISAGSDVDQDPRPRLSSRTGIRPAEPPTPTPTKTPIRAITKHKVAEGENVHGLAERYQISAETIVRANHLDDPEHLTPGQELIILPVSGRLHVVVSGDTVLDLATRYQVTPEDIVAGNQLADANALQVGQRLVIPDGPVGARDAPPAEPKPLQKPLAPIKYQVASGDTLSGIAQKFGISMQSVVWANPTLANPERLQIGQALVLPPVSGVLHTVSAGDTVNGVAARYDASSAEIIKVNSLQEPYTLSIGQLLIVPGGQPPAAVAASPLPAPAPKPAPAPAPAQAVAAVQSSGLGPTAANVAMRYLGYRYTWAGASPSTGFDCSGLTSYAYRQAGRPIPRDLWGQLSSGSRVSRAGLQVGDLVFFQNTYTAGLSHVGIYVGGGRFVHASSPTTGVITSSLSDAYWSARYLGASRP